MVAACSGSTSTSPAAGSAAASAAGAAASAAGGSAVEIKNFAFNPASLTASVGAKVTWTNQDTTGHTVTADDGSFDSKEFPNGQTFSQTFSKAGTFAYHCTIHTTMKGTIVVS
jgi:plastocyanin